MTSSMILLLVVVGVVGIVVGVVVGILFTMHAITDQECNPGVFKFNGGFYRLYECKPYRPTLSQENFDKYCLIQNKKDLTKED